MKAQLVYYSDKLYIAFLLKIHYNKISNITILFYYQSQSYIKAQVLCKYNPLLRHIYEEIQNMTKSYYNRQCEQTPQDKCN